MTLSEKYENAIKDIDHQSFNSVNGTFEKLIELLENHQSESDDPVFYTILVKAEELKKEAISLLKNEREDIMKMAKENGIPLSELGIDPNENLFESSASSED